MTTAAQLRKAALANPGAAEDDGTFTVGGNAFAALGPSGTARLRLPAAAAADLRSQHPSATQDGAFVSLPLKDINGMALNHWVRLAWAATAPPEPRERAAAADKAAAGAVGDLPAAIGRPATRALANAGITTLDQVAALTDAELAALHGVGPKAVRVLREALDGRPHS